MSAAADCTITFSVTVSKYERLLLTQYNQQDFATFTVESVHPLRIKERCISEGLFWVVRCPTMKLSLVLANGLQAYSADRHT